MILTIFFSIALDTLPVQPVKTLLPRPVKSESTKPKQNESKNRKAGNTNNGGRRIAPISLVNR
jgi:hypothetical protein